MPKKIISKQKQFFYSGQTKTYSFRKKQLQLLYESIKKYEKEILQALYLDLGKPEFEGYATEVGYSLDSLRHFIKNLKKWMKDEKVRTPLHQPMSKSFIRSEPFGQVLIIGPYNYPFQLIIEPLAGAIAAGNTCVIKPSEYCINTEKIIKKMIEDTFDGEYIKVVTGGVEITKELLDTKFDYIFFTGSDKVGKIVMSAAAKTLTPVTLELGGKSPAIIDKDANIKIAAKRIAWGKFMNTGQTCIAPDYLYVHQDIKEKFLKEMKKIIIEFYGTDASISIDYGRIVNKKHFNRLLALIEHENIYYGGAHNEKKLYIEPTILDNVDWTHKVMKEEIFGPILPVMEFSDLNVVIEQVRERPKPLSLYLFSENKQIQDKILNELSFGGGCINDIISHIATPYMPFGGVGSSGVGSYHGKYSFETFSNKKSILKKSTKFDLNLIYPPYKDKIKIVKRIMK